MPLEPPVLPAAPELPVPRLPEPVEPVEPVLPAPAAPLLPVLDELEPPADEEPEAEPCSRRQRSFSEPVRLSHWMELPTLGVLVEELPLVLGEVALGDAVELESPLDEPAPVALWLPPTL